MNIPAYFCFDNLYCNFLTDIKSNSIAQQMLYPNPATTIVNTTEKVNEVTFYTVDGKEVYSKAGLFESFNISILPEGVYVVKMKSGEKEYYQKLLKK